MTVSMMTPQRKSYLFDTSGQAKRTDAIIFFVPGKPEALKRHRMGKGFNYDPSKAAKESFLVQAMQHKPDKPIDQPIGLFLSFRFSRPKSHFTVKGILKESASKMHTSRPDADNLEKFVMDALNEVFWRDDALICRLWAEKVYSEVPGVMVRVEPTDAEYFGFVEGFKK